MQLFTWQSHPQGVCIYPYISICVSAFWRSPWLYYLAGSPLIEGRYSTHLPLPWWCALFILREVDGSHIRYWDVKGCSIRERPQNPTSGRCGSFVSLYVLELIDWIMIITVNISRSMRHMVFALKVVNRCQGYSRSPYRQVALRSSLGWPFGGWEGINSTFRHAWTRWLR